MKVISLIYISGLINSRVTGIIIETREPIEDISALWDYLMWIVLDGLLILRQSQSL